MERKKTEWEPANLGVAGTPLLKWKYYYAGRGPLLAESATVWRLSVCPVGIFTVIHQGAVRDAASVHFGNY